MDGRPKDPIKLPKLQVYQNTQQLPASSDSLHQLRLSMQADDEFALLKHTIMQGWLRPIKLILPELQLFWTFREELTVEDGLKNSDTKQAVQSHPEIASQMTLSSK